MSRRGGILATALLASAACRVYGEDDAAAPPPVPVADPLTDAGATERQDALSGEAPITTDDAGDASVADAAAPTDAGADAPPPLPDLYVFVTSKPIAAKIPAPYETKADAFCNDLAANYPERFIGRKFVAWIGGVASTPKERIVAKAKGHRYIRPDGMLVAADPFAMIGGGALHAPITVTEAAIYLTSPIEVWTGVAANGAAMTNCAGWSSDDANASGAYGLAGSTSAWTLYGTASCDTPRSLYCFEVP